MKDSKPRVLLVQLGDSMQTSFFYDMYLALLSEIGKLYEVIKKDTAATIIQYLSQPNLQLNGVLVVDGGLVQPRFKKVQIKISEYAKAGGSVIMCCLFSSFVSPSHFDASARDMGLKWESGDYHRTNFALNPLFESEFGKQTFSSLSESYSMKALHLKGVSPETKIYFPTEESDALSAAVAPGEVDTAQSPAVWQKHGDGFVGFIGDVNNEAGSQTLLMAMLSKCITHGGVSSCS